MLDCTSGPSIILRTSAGERLLAYESALRSARKPGSRTVSLQRSMPKPNW